MRDLYGLIGEKLTHSYSPMIHKEILKKINKEGEYHLFEVQREGLKNAIGELISLNAKGVNVTIPYKIEIIEYIDELSEEAKNIGAVNTICFKDNTTIGYNTDYYGFGMMLNEFDVDIKNKKAVVLGAGGAAKSVIHYLSGNGIREVVIVSRNVDKAKDEYSEYMCISYQDLIKLKDFDIIINSTPCGMYPKIQESPVERNILENFQTAVDLIYNPSKTVFLKYADELGLKSVNGLYMLVAQAVKAQELWNDINIDNNITKEVYLYLQNILYAGETR